MARTQSGTPAGACTLDFSAEQAWLLATLEPPSSIAEMRIGPANQVIALGGGQDLNCVKDRRIPTSCAIVVLDQAGHGLAFTACSAFKAFRDA